MTWSSINLWKKCARFHRLNGKCVVLQTHKTGNLMRTSTHSQPYANAREASEHADVPMLSGNELRSSMPCLLLSVFSFSNVLIVN